MTSPQHRIATGQMISGGRMTSPVNPYGQQGMVQSQMMTNQQQNRFIRPQMMNMQDRMPISGGPRQQTGQMMTIQQQQMHQLQQQQQQQVQQQQVNRQNNSMYPNSPLGSPQPILSNPQQLNMDNVQNQRTMQLIQQRQQIQRQQMLHQQQQQSNQQQVMSKMSPIQQQPPTTNQASTVL